MKTSMKKRAVGLTYLMGVVAVLAAFLPARAGPSISVESSTSFTHEASVRVPFRPPDDSVASLNIDGGIYYFATSPSGEFFAVVSDRTVSIFSKTE